MKELEKLLEGFENKDKVISAVEKIKEDAGKAGSNKANKEAQGLRERLNSIKKPMQKFGIDIESESIDSDIEELVQKIETSNDSSKNPEIQALKKQLDSIQKERDEEKETNLKLKKETFLSNVRSNVDKYLSEKKVIDGDVSEIIMGKLDLSDHTIDPKDLKFNDSEGTPFSEGVDKYFESKPHLIQNTDLPGGGTHENNGGSGGANEEKSAGEIMYG